MLKNIDNITILTEVGEIVTLPSVLIARQDNDSLTTVPVTWSPNKVNTLTKGEFIFEGTVKGYTHKVLCSVQVGEMEDNPESTFPDELDEFGSPKKDIQTSDIMDIDDYQYFKAKIPRTVTENIQLKQLRELLADKIILARDINHMRNAIIALEEYSHGLNERITNIEDRLDNIKNIGNGAKIFHKIDENDKELKFRTLKGKNNTNVFEDGEEIIIDVDAVGCGTDIKSQSFETCGEKFPFRAEDGKFGFRGFMNVQMVELDNGYHTMLWVLGQGTNGDFDGCARIMKGKNKFFIEMKYGDLYRGMELSSDLGRFYYENHSLIDNELKKDNGNGINIWSDDVKL